MNKKKDIHESAIDHFEQTQDDPLQKRIQRSRAEGYGAPPPHGYEESVPTKQLQIRYPLHIRERVKVISAECSRPMSKLFIDMMEVAIKEYEADEADNPASPPPLVPEDLFKKSKLVASSIFCPAPLHSRLKIIAVFRNRPMSKLIIDIIADGLSKYDRKTGP